MTAEEAAELLEIFRRDTSEPPELDPATMSKAYVMIAPAAGEYRPSLSD